MTLPVLSDGTVTLRPVSLAVARAAVRSDGPTPTAELAAALAAEHLTAARGWPHLDTADALRPLAEYGSPGDDGGWLVVTGGEVAGECGWLGGPRPDGTVEIGYGLSAQRRGQGVGTAAVRLMTDWCAVRPGVRVVAAEVLPGNEASRRLLVRLGFTQDTSGDRAATGGHPGHLRYVREVTACAGMPAAGG